MSRAENAKWTSPQQIKRRATTATSSSYSPQDYENISSSLVDVFPIQSNCNQTIMKCERMEQRATGILMALGRDGIA